MTMGMMIMMVMVMQPKSGSPFKSLESSILLKFVGSDRHCGKIPSLIVWHYWGYENMYVKLLVKRPERGKCVRLCGFVDFAYRRRSC